MKTKRLIINIDDFGIDGDTNRAAFDLITAGKATSASILVKRNETCCKEALGFASRFEGAASFGLHLDLSSYFRFEELGLWGRDETHIVEDYREIFAENRQTIIDDVRRQFDVLEQNGVHVAHVDGHHHVHLFPEILYELVPIMLDRGIRAMRFMKEFYTTPERRAEIEAYLRDHGIATPDRFIPGIPKDENSLLVDGTNEAMIHACFHTYDGQTEYEKLMNQHCFSDAELISYRDI
jgi:predicted glycoside hydrolase/deacetylase ChbG (UPF0249 family)